MGLLRVSHLGLCVADLGRSVRFYRDGLGFREVSRLDIAGPHVDTLLSLADASLEAVYLERDGLRLELLHYPEPGHETPPVPRPMNRLGFTHLSFRVDDIEATLRALIEHGARQIAGTHVGAPGSRAGAVFVTDPDGTRIELVEAPGDPARLPGE